MLVSSLRITSNYKAVNLDIKYRKLSTNLKLQTPNNNNSNSDNSSNNNNNLFIKWLKRICIFSIIYLFKYFVIDYLELDLKNYFHFMFVLASGGVLKDLLELLVKDPMTLGGPAGSSNTKPFKFPTVNFSFQGPGGHELLNNPTQANNTPGTNNAPGANNAPGTPANVNPAAADLVAPEPLETTKERVRRVYENNTNPPVVPVHLAESLTQELGPFDTSSFPNLADSVEQRIVRVAVNNKLRGGNFDATFGNIGLDQNSEAGQMVIRAIRAGNNAHGGTNMHEGLSAPHKFSRTIL